MTKPSAGANTVTVTILDQHYQVSCPPEQREALLDAGRYLDEQMRVIRSKGRVIGVERIAVMAALNMAYDLLHGDSAAAKDGGVTMKELRELNNKLGKSLQDLRQLEI
ncbi:MAG: cell division protein ZapA [Gammaproteobacteria bacterium]|nr:MAG: cell division protein ZapA [Gammaproteobacteria bacterium]